jgi:hypothetical protein
MAIGVDAATRMDGDSVLVSIERWSWDGNS